MSVRPLVCPLSIAQNAYLCPSLPNDHHAIAQNAYLCPSLTNDHHAYQLSDLLSRLLSLSACFTFILDQLL